MSACSGSGRRELRFKPQQNTSLNLVEQFESLPMGDLWEDAKLWEPIAYLLKSRRVRQDVAICVHQVFEHKHLYRKTHYI